MAKVLDPIVSDDKKAVLLPIQLARDRDGGRTSTSQPLLDVTAAAAAEHEDLDIAQVGDASIDLAINDRVGEDLATAETLSLPITLVIMLIAFGALIAAGIPVLLAISGVVATIGLYAPISHLIPAEDTVASMVLLIGMAVGVDYSLFYLKREREEREKGHSTRRRGRDRSRDERALDRRLRRCGHRRRWPACTSSRTRPSPRSPPARSSWSRCR